ncbi:hypothetical protein MAPG_08259 [Magnaporthiopsis poae ATCC 64411]|uniref:Uncharacterized protein n=1 Tax=Magnaporthiopsis poae (strain ATCC 64411 / 73-15) TaxID=644358 RepID=A0A0C4E6W2_MAGP6|nr:hypothetical protein MAPG_08259 [Magnaporthiopsis poae ATCC 64411]
MVSETPKRTGHKAATTPKDNDKLTEREIEILSKAWTCMRNQPEIDMNKLADALGMTNVGSATNAWGRIKKKIFGNLPSGGVGGMSTGRKRKTPAKVVDDGSDDAAAANGGRGDDDEEETPSKKPRKGPTGPRKPRGTKAAATPKVKAQDSGDEADNGEVKDEPKHEDDDEDRGKPSKSSFTNSGFTAVNTQSEMAGSA